jgi:hypothetical protein
MMNRTTVLTVAVMGAVGFALGWWKFGAPTGSHSGHEHTVLKPTPNLAKAQHKFRLLPADIHADRETPALAAAAEGRVVLAWASQTGEDERTLFLARSADSGATFEAPVPWRKVPIYRFTSPGKEKGKAMAFSTHVLPRLAAGLGGLYLGWVEAIDGGPKVAYFVARSTDGGRSFSEPVRAHGDGASRPGFTSLSVAPDGSVCCAWLDGRNGGQQPFFSVWPKGADGFEPEWLVYSGSDDKGVCPCCDTAVLRAPGGLDLVAFRNSEGGYRDIWLSKSRTSGERGFEPPVPVTADHWPFNGCPHDGPALALLGDRLNLTWMDAHTGRNRVYFANTALASLSLSPRELSPGSPSTQGHPKLAPSGPKLLHAVWDEGLGADGPAQELEASGHHHAASLDGGGRALMYAASQDGGETFQPALAIAARQGAFQLNPAIAVGPDGAVYVAWNEIDTEGKQVVFARLAAESEGR